MDAIFMAPFLTAYWCFGWFGVLVAFISLMVVGGLGCVAEDSNKWYWRLPAQVIGVPLGLLWFLSPIILDITH